MQDDNHIERVRAQFGPSADLYATSDVHAAGESLSLLVDLLRPRGGRMLDVATGAGHTALAFARHVDSVVASDVTEQMLAAVRRLASERSIRNVETVQARAEELPFSDGSFDIVTCRIAFHHFEHQRSAIEELSRVLKPGGILGFTDNVTVADPAAAEYYNAYEKLRDPSHHRVLNPAVLAALFDVAGLSVRSTRVLTKEFEFHEWADRQHVDEATKERLLEMMRTIPDPLDELFRPRWDDATMYFTLREAVIVAEKR